MARTGRPKIAIDKKKFENLCALQCTLPEFAVVFDCSEDTIERWCQRTYKKTFAEVFKVKRGKGTISLRRYQFQMAQKNPTMAIWLGKQWLGQKDKIEQSIEETSEEILSEIAAEIKRVKERDKQE